MAGPEALTGVESLAIHPVESERLYAGTARGVWVSADGGRRWRLPPGGLPHRAAGVSVPPWRPDLLLAATLEGAFAGRADGTGWKPLPSHPSWWGVITGFAFLSRGPRLVFAVTHEGVVAARKLAGGEWVPAAELRIDDGSLSPLAPRRSFDVGTCGMLYKSDLVMYDRRTRSLPAQTEGRTRGSVTGRAGVRRVWHPEAANKEITMEIVGIPEPEEFDPADQRFLEATKAWFKIAFVPKMSRVLLRVPEFGRPYGRASRRAMGDGALTRAQKELIAATVSAINVCGY